MLGDWAHEGLRPPSSMEEREELKEAQHAAHLRPPRTRGAISALLEGSQRDPRPRPASPPRSRVANLPSSGQNISASLEGSEPTLEQGESSPPRLPVDKEDKRPCRSPARRTEALNATTPPQHPGQTALGRHSPQWL